MRDGDIYHFTYHAHARSKWVGDPCWCFDGQLVVRDGRLLDTYWSGIGPHVLSCVDGRSFTPEEARGQGR